MAFVPKHRQSLIHGQARIQAPWIKVTIGKYTFGVFDKKGMSKNAQGNYETFNVQYPDYIESLNIIKINGQVNQYTLTLKYPVRSCDDPNLIEKILSSVTRTREIIFSYGDACNPAYIYKDEKALITKVDQNFQLESSVITYTIHAVSGAALAGAGVFNFINNAGVKKQPSDEIKRVFNDSTYGLQKIFTGMTKDKLNQLIDSTDAAVELDSKTNTSAIDYITYLVSCMVPQGATQSTLSKDIYIMTIHDETVFDTAFSDSFNSNTAYGGPYFKVTRVSTNTMFRADAYEVDVGINTSTIVLGFTISNNENYSMLYDYAADLQTEQYSTRINNQGQWEQIYTPMITSGNNRYLSRAEDKVWFTKLTKYPISATIKIQGLLRPATLLQYIRLNVIFPGGNSHISSGLYIVTKQVDEINGSGYFTTLDLTRISN
jgi:hypothetical protein